MAGALLTAAGAFFVSGLAPTGPAPRGLLSDGPANVLVFNGQWYGAPPEAPFATVSDAFELEGFPYGDEGTYCSVFFVKEGSPAIHVSVQALGEDQEAAPELGILQMRSLVSGQGSVTGAVVQLDAQSRFVERYLDAEVTFQSVSGERINVGSGGPLGFELALQPGSYEVLLNGEQASTPEVVITAGQGVPLVLSMPDQPTGTP